MSCLEFRRRALLSAGALPQHLQSHARACRCCAEFQRSCAELEAGLEGAIRVEPPPGLAERILLAQRARRAPGRWWRHAFGAAVAAALLIAIFLQRDAAPTRDYALAAIEHVIAEPQSFTKANATDPGIGRRTLAARGVTVPGRLGVTRYAENCVYAGMRVKHFVFRGAMGDVTIIVPVEPVSSPPPSMTMAHGMTGMVVPTATGFITVVSEANEAVDELYRTIGTGRRAASGDTTTAG